MTNPTARERAEAICKRYGSRFNLESNTGQDPIVDQIESAITAAEQAAREDERQKIAKAWEEREAETRKLEDRYDALYDQAQTAFRRGAEAMRELIAVRQHGNAEFIRSLSPPQPAGGAE